MGIALVFTVAFPAGGGIGAEVLDNWQLDEYDRVDTGPAVIQTVFIFQQIVYEIKVDGFIDHPQDIEKSQETHADFPGFVDSLKWLI